MRIKRFHSRDQRLCKFIGTEEGTETVDVLLFWDTKMTDVTSCENAVYATSTFPIMHLICPPPPKKKTKKTAEPLFFISPVLLGITLLMQNFGGQIRCIMGNVEVAYRNIVLVANTVCATNYKIKNL